MIVGPLKRKTRQMERRAILTAYLLLSGQMQMVVSAKWKVRLVK
jgi:hypothetical protein